MKVQKFVIDGEDIEVKDTQARNNIGDLSDLDTTNKDNLVEAINEVSSSGGVESYDDLTNKPSINGVTLSGNKTTSDLHIQAGGVSDYDDLDNKPSINGVTLSGNQTTSDLNIDYDDLSNRPVESGNVDMDSIVDPLPPIATEEKVLFDERGTEYTVGWYINSNGKRKPVYRIDKIANNVPATNTTTTLISDFKSNYSVDEILNTKGFIIAGNGNQIEMNGISDGTMSLTMLGNGNMIVYVPTSTVIISIFKYSIQYTKTTDEWEDIPS